MNSIKMCHVPFPGLFCFLMDWMMEGKHMLSRLNPKNSLIQSPCSFKLQPSRE